MKKINFISLFILFILFINLPLSFADNLKQTKKIFVIYSFNQFLPAHNNINQGLQAVFKSNSQYLIEF